MKLFNTCLFLTLLFTYGASRAQEQDATKILASSIVKLNFNTSIDTLKKIMNDLQALRKNTDNSYLDYWTSYSQYLLYFKINKNEKDAVEAIQTGMNILEKCKNKSSEHYALLALFIGFDISYSSFNTIPAKAAMEEKYARMAIQLNPKNLRGYYALAIKDFYTPTEYGGGKIVEENLLKAISLEDKSDPNPFSPSWGKDDAYWHLVMFYEKQDQKDLAIKYLNEGLLKFPEHYGLNRMKTKLLK